MPPSSRATGRGGARAGFPAGQRERLRAAVEPVVARAGYDVEELTVSRVGRRHLVRLVVDGDGGTSLDAIAEVSRAVSTALDAAESSGGELFAGEYQLEVSSPGVDRPLTQPRHWRRNTGRLVSVRMADRQVTGRITGADGAGVLLDLDGTARRVSYAELGPGRVQIEFNRLDELDDLPPAEDDGTDLAEAGTDLADDDAELADDSAELAEDAAELAEDGTELADDSAELADDGHVELDSADGPAPVDEPVGVDGQAAGQADQDRTGQDGRSRYTDGGLDEIDGVDDDGNGGRAGRARPDSDAGGELDNGARSRGPASRSDPVRPAELDGMDDFDKPGDGNEEREDEER